MYRIHKSLPYRCRLLIFPAKSVDLLRQALVHIYYVLRRKPAFFRYVNVVRNKTVEVLRDAKGTSKLQLRETKLSLL